MLILNFVPRLQSRLGAKASKNLLILNFLEHLEGSFYKRIREFNAAFLAGHCLDEFGPVGFREALHSGEACPAADVADVLACLVLAWRCPARDDVGDAVQMVLPFVGPEQAEGSSCAPVHALKLDKLSVRLFCSLPFPGSTCNPPNV